jgi:hypothetical protein
VEKMPLVEVIVKEKRNKHWQQPQIVGNMTVGDFTKSFKF